MAKVPFVDLTWQWRQIEAETLPMVTQLLQSGAYAAGPVIDQFEAEFADMLGVRFGVGVDSGTSALHLALKVAGIGPGDEVLIPAHTFVATAWPVVYLGAKPVLCDVEAESGNLDFDAAEKWLTKRTKAVIPVHLYGQPANMERLARFAEDHDLRVIEDAAQAHGASFAGQPIGSFGHLACFSFYPSKNLGAVGNAGLIATDDPDLADRARRLRDHGQRSRYLHEEVGYNYRMDTLQATVLREKLRHLEAWNTMRRVAAKHYLDLLVGLPLELPKECHGRHVYHLFVVRTENRDELRTHLGEHGIETGLHYPVPLHRQPCFVDFGYDQDSYPVADNYADQCLSLPLYPGITESQTAFVAETIQDFFAQRGKSRTSRRALGLA